MVQTSHNDKHGKTYIIGITGGSGSGKTTFIQKLKGMFSDDELCIISQDDYYKERHKQEKDKNDVRNFDLPTSILSDEMLSDLLRLENGEEIRRKEYVFNNEKAVPKELVFKSAPVIIVEGLFVFHHRGLSEKCDLKLFVEAKDNLKVIRRIKRDRMERNYPLEDVLYRYEHHVLPAFEKFIQPYKEEADLIINNDEDFDTALSVIAGFIRSLLIV